MKNKLNPLVVVLSALLIFVWVGVFSYTLSVGTTGYVVHDGSEVEEINESVEEIIEAPEPMLGPESSIPNLISIFMVLTLFLVVSLYFSKNKR
ncbi:hypothetical protein HOA59_00315 [archaeon]|jgi:hypothetical protein|nr:hypothetical protein [archaeon]MBT6823865.1 hypothetical protein [archaeon]MBT7107396.1 hypothetical protein [archaeon]